MAKIKAEHLGTAKCATNKQTDTVDGAIHEMVKLHPLVVIEKDDLKSFNAAIQSYLNLGAAIANGEKLELLDGNGAVGATATPSDSVPKQTPQTEVIYKKDKKGNFIPDKDGNNQVELTIVRHGQNVAKTLPGIVLDDDGKPTFSYAALIDAINDGLSKGVSANGRKAVTDQFKTGDGTRGRKPAEVDFKSVE